MRGASRPQNVLQARTAQRKVQMEKAGEIQVEWGEREALRE